MPFIAPHAVFLVLASPFVGSFIGLLTHRIPREQQVVFGRSACDSCGAKLAVPDLIPILSWLRINGTARCCGRRISADYPLIEAACVIATLLTALFLPSSTVVWGSMLVWILIALSAIDVRDRILPDGLTYLLALIGLLQARVLFPHTFLDHVFGLLAGLVFLLTVHWAYRYVRRRDGLGLGDVKLFSAGGAWVSWQGLPTVLCIAASVALAYSLLMYIRTREPIKGMSVPFGPFLSVGIWLVWFSHLQPRMIAP